MMDLQWSDLIGRPVWRDRSLSDAGNMTGELDKLRERGGAEPGSPRPFSPSAIDIAIESVEPLLPASIRIIPGFLTDLLEPLRRAGLSSYLDAQTTAAKRFTADVEKVDMNTQASAAENAVKIREAIGRAPGRVCLISHSKGGVDVLTCLLDADDLWSKIACWIAFQAPFAGSPVAQAALDWPVVRTVSDVLLTALGGSLESAHDLTPLARQKCFDTRAADIARLCTRVPVISAAAATDARRLFWPLQPPWSWMKGAGIDNDGLVPRTSAVLPGSRYVLLDGVDHVSSVSNGTPDKDRQNTLLTLGLLALALK